MSFFKFDEPALEAEIKRQDNDKVVNDLVSKISAIREYYVSNKEMFQDPIVFFVNKKTKAIIEEMIVILSKRFFNKEQAIRFVNSSYSPLGIYTVPPRAKTIFENNGDDILEDVNDLNNYWLNTTRETKDAVDVTDMDDNRDYKKIMNDVANSIISLDEKLKSSSVEFDLLNAKVKGLPDDYLTYMFINFKYFLDGYSDRELVACILHEIGHAFTHMLFVYRGAKTNTAMINTINRYGSEKGPDVIKILYKDLGGNESDLEKDNSTKSVIKNTVMLVNKYFENTTNISYNSLTSRDSEYIADNFSAKFGLQIELVTSLNKISSSGSEVDIRASDYVLMNLNMLGFVFYLLLNLISGGTLIIKDFILFLIMTALNSILFLFLGGYDSRKLTYDDLKRRLQRIKNDFIRMINESNLSKDVIAIKLAEFDLMEKIIENTPKDRNIFGIINEVIYSKNRKHAAETFYQQMLEDTTDNKLAISSARLKQYV